VAKTKKESVHAPINLTLNTLFGDVHNYYICLGWSKPCIIVLLNCLCIMNIFVAKLNFKTKKEDLERAFSQFGEVSSAKVVTDRDTGRSKGFGFVEMPNDSEALAAIDGLNEKELDGRVIVVKPANPKPAGNQ
jgi:RNA recognition motif-containing protein